MSARRLGPVFVSSVIAVLCGGSMGAQEPRPNSLPTTRERPNSFGTLDYTVTTISAAAFVPGTGATQYSTTGSLGRQGATNTISEYYASLAIPAGAVIDRIGLNNMTSVDSAYRVELIQRRRDGSLIIIGGVDSIASAGWDTDYNVHPIGYLWGEVPSAGHALILRVQLGSHPTLQFFGSVEIWWKRSVSSEYDPLFVFFDDVPVGHPQKRFITALAAAGITAGCGGGNYCPDAAVTRGQMAVFLSVALGLHHPQY